MSRASETLGIGLHKALIGLGANLGDPDYQIGRAVELLGQHDDISVLAVSPLRTTKPVGGPPQPDYRNGAALLETTRTPPELLWLLKDTEKALGRSRGGQRWGPRLIDLDLLLYDEVEWADAELTVPHPLMAKRLFVLEAAAKIAPDMRHVGLNRTVRELYVDLRFGEAPTRGDE